MMKNVGGTDRVIRIILGVALLSLFYFLPGYWKLAGLISLPFLITGIAQKCAINQMLGRNTCKIR
ncbi:MULTISPECIES: DUF2892 domain-containing protein [unclassified Paenibacillus]|jgi:hypothetical protein|uniref:YgaP family membrane protein n=2 Tax=unclassified Paenibacillus TaxID=185978 RepID=UPI002780083B|nr:MULTISPECIES: DUF2892 domain-containing protein [unclassified Paenibacillus]MDF2649316.1 hypothetical protein [Paenibacillus sp.]MDQ0898839.1 hypothetical protein [Paenibacillus sp. V4I7]MDQ0915172.1 hypothetical protein [Paenibacillus sp. V4I5]